MKYNLNENVFDLLKKVDLDEDLDPSIDGTALLYEDDDFSKTPKEADKYRTNTEEVLGFELDGNQVEYLATNWAEFYHNAKKHAKMKDQIIDFLREQGLTNNLPEEDEKNIVIPDDIDDDIDYEEKDNPDALHPHQQLQPTQQISAEANDVENESLTSNHQFSPIKVQSWDIQATPDDSKDPMSDINNMANEMVDTDDLDDSDDMMLDYMVNVTSK